MPRARVSLTRAKRAGAHLASAGLGACADPARHDYTLFTKRFSWGGPLSARGASAQCDACATIREALFDQPSGALRAALTPEM